MSKVVGAGLPSRVRRFSAGGLSDKENSPLGVSRLRTLLKRKAKKAENTTSSVKAKKVKATKQDAWVDLKDGTTIKLCSSCATKKNNLTTDNKKTKDKSKTTKKVKENADEHNNKRTLRGTKKKITDKSEKKLKPDIKEKNVIEKKDVTSKLTKPKDTKKSKQNIFEINASTVNKENEGKNEMDSHHSNKPIKIKRIPKKSLNIENDIVKESKITTSNVTIKEKDATSKKNKIIKVPKSATRVANKIIVKVPKPKKTNKNNSPNTMKPEIKQMNNIDSVDSINENKEQKVKRNKKKDEIKESKSKNTKRTIKIKSNITDKNTGKMNNVKLKKNSVKIPKLKKKINKINNEIFSDNNNVSDTNENVDNTTSNKTGKSKVIKRGLALVAKKVKTKGPVRKSVDIQTKKKKSPPRILSKNKQIKPDKLNHPQNTINKNSNNNSIDNLITPDIGIHSTLIEDNIYENRETNTNKTLEKNQNLEPIDTTIVKMEPLDDYNPISNIEYASSGFKNQVSLQNDSDVLKLKPQKKLTKSERLLHVTFRNKSMEHKPKSTKKLKDKKCRKKKEARNKFKNDKKVAKAIGLMSKHFAMFQKGSIGEQSSYVAMSESFDSNEDSSSHSCHCEPFDSSSSSSGCNCWKCRMEESSSSSSWTGSSESSDETSFSNNNSESSFLKDLKRNPVNKKHLSKSYELRNRNV